MATKCVDDFRLRFGKQELVPIVVGGMGVDISTATLALEAARLGGVGHISDAMVQTVSDRRAHGGALRRREHDGGVCGGAEAEEDQAE